jgi:hypothetical protein
LGREGMGVEVEGLEGGGEETEAWVVAWGLALAPELEEQQGYGGEEGRRVNPS